MATSRMAAPAPPAARDAPAEPGPSRALRRSACLQERGAAPAVPRGASGAASCVMVAEGQTATAGSGGGIQRELGDACNARSKVEEYCAALDGLRPLRSVLIANNGIAAVKFIRSIRSWAYESFGEERAVQLVAMATPEDIRVNAEHIRMADQFVEVPGGTNNNNYANVQLIVEVAERTAVDAVWPGWGHASESPELSATLAKRDIVFLGPPAGPMLALGDKIGSTLIAQAAGIPTLPWSGSHVSTTVNTNDVIVPEEVYMQACIHTPDEAITSCQAVGYPAMIKASWGGGGKGIRKVHNEDEVRPLFQQVQGEVPGSPIFIMKVASQSRHLEVQLLCDAYGSVAVLHTRDCSVQRRHQKIIEEGPATVAPPGILQQLELGAARLTKSVGYVGVATVEYLYSMETKAFYFLELNPRLQVEHPVTEWIAGVNLPAAQLGVGMGIPLWRMPEIRRLYRQEAGGGLESWPVSAELATPFSLGTGNDRAQASKPRGHVVAVRITSEDPDDGFKPTSGRIQELSFRSKPDVWAYFSVKVIRIRGLYGHLFAFAETRLAAVGNMVLALKELHIRGEIRSNVDYTADLLQDSKYLSNEIHTGWLDSRIALRVRVERPPWHISVLAGALYRATRLTAARTAEYIDYLEKGQIPPKDISLVKFRIVLSIDGSKYTLEVTKKGGGSYSVQLNQSWVDAEVHILRDGGLLVQLDGSSHVVYAEEETLGTRLLIGGRTCLLQNDHDPSRLVAETPCRLLRFLVPDGSHLSSDMAYAEVEVMKMCMPLLVPMSGRIHYKQQEGAMVQAGELVAILDLNDPSAIRRAVPFADGFPPLGTPTAFAAKVHQRCASALNQAHRLLAGYDYPADEVVHELLLCLDDARLPFLQWEESLAVLAARLPINLKAELETVLQSASADGKDQFPVQEVQEVIEGYILGGQPFEETARRRLLSPLLELATSYEGGLEGHARNKITSLFAEYLDIESIFTNSNLAEVIEGLRQQYKSDLSHAVRIVLSHQGLARKNELVLRLMAALVLPNPGAYCKSLVQFAALSLPEHAEASNSFPVTQSTVTPGTFLFQFSQIANTYGTENSCTFLRYCLSPTPLRHTLPMMQVAVKASRLLEKTKLNELRATIARTCSGLEMFTGIEGAAAGEVCKVAPEKPKRVTDGMPNEEAGRCQQVKFGEGVRRSLDERMEAFVDAPAPVEDALASLFGHSDSALQRRVVEAYIYRLYEPYFVNDSLLIRSHTGALAATWRFWEEECPPLVSELLSDTRRRESGSTTYRSGALLVVSSLSQISEVVNSVLKSWALSHKDAAGLLGSSNGTLSPRDEAFGVASSLAFGNNFHIALVPQDGMKPRDDQIQVEILEALPHMQLREASVGVVSCVIAQPEGLSFVRQSFQWSEEQSCYMEKSLLRHLEPPVSNLLNMEKLAAFEEDMSHATSRDSQWHMWTTSSKSGGIRRVFLRSVVRQPRKQAAQTGSLATGFESPRLRSSGTPCLIQLEESLVRAFKGALEELELAPGRGNHHGHMYLSVLRAVAMAMDDSQHSEGAIHALTTMACQIDCSFGLALQRMGVSNWEIRFRIRSAGTSNGAWRLVASNPSGHACIIHVYREAKGSLHGSELIYFSPPSDRHPPGPLHGTRLAEPYTSLSQADIRRLVARQSGTTYCYDFPLVFRTSLDKMWTEASSRGGSKPDLSTLEAVELVLEEGLATWDRRVVECKRPAACNKVAMVAWQMTLRTPEYPGRAFPCWQTCNPLNHRTGLLVCNLHTQLTSGRTIFVVANDVTLHAGAFGPPEDALFKRVAELACEQRLPIIYLAANSGARIGLAEEVRACFRVAWLDEAHPEQGFQYLYLTKEDYARVGDSVVANEIRLQGDEVRYVLSDIIGREDGLGVENLAGSGAIAGVFARAYQETFTLTYVSGRTVGIGAYLARLGVRCIQRADQPIILTGFSTLNKLLGREVYTSHMQLGGPRIMAANGVVHCTVADDLEGATAVLAWLAYVPAVGGGALPVLTPMADPTSRAVEYVPDTTCNPRAAIGGTTAPGRSGDSSWLGGIFDCGSFRECLEGWGQTVVTGRARLGGVPIGVVAVETHTVVCKIPADPGQPQTGEREVSQAGQVWFPDSAAKTAQALSDFDREGLPAFVLANWRGFSGGQRDLFEGVLQAGATIVERLRGYRQPIFVYVPRTGELRGGAWVVVDSAINPDMIETYADTTAHGSVLEPDGIVEVKFRRRQLLECMQRLDKRLARLDGPVEGVNGNSTEVKEGRRHAHEQKERLLPVYKQVAVRFAELHSTAVRMKAKGVIREVVPWDAARRFFSARLAQRLAEEQLVKELARRQRCSGRPRPRADALRLVQDWLQDAQQAFVNSGPSERLLLAVVRLDLSSSGRRDREPGPHGNEDFPGLQAFVEERLCAAEAEFIADTIVELRLRQADLAGRVVGTAGLLQEAKEAVEPCLQQPEAGHAVGQGS
eukprot:SM000269S09913  [mRNA]  locus=s269:25943:40084:- [translate_table: standard]